MAAEIVKMYREQMPELRLIGKRYGDGDRDANGSFGPKWDEWNANDWFAPLFGSAAAIADGDATLGGMRFTEGVFEYWIGLFCPSGTSVPEGYTYVDLDAGEIASFWVRGSMENGEIFGMDPCAMCMEAIKKEGWKTAPDGWFFERYADARFLTGDSEGKVILDYCYFLA